ncbi:hypothetical protein GOODEAATRI_003349 [Goodea atripinnis]|uniref:Choline/carnitine acyltransferase domain-containing protein n=1 Tax=Goodea atripinnis TaxID=208336 RepID=A0ABV0MEP2_9TELE
MVKTCALGRPRHLVKPVSATRVAGRYLTHQRGLPGLPVPPLQQTCERYITALEPIVEADELTHTRRVIQEFQEAGGVGEQLQRGLEKRAGETENWVRPEAVLSVCRFASKLIAGVLDFKTMIDKIPGLKRDSVVNHAKSSQPPRHITVVHNFQFFQLDVYNRDGTPLTADQLCLQLEKICRASQETNAEPVGILTTQHRDVWGKSYLNLIKDKTNKESVSAIQRSIFTLCLDGATPEAAGELYRSCAAVQMLHGGGSQSYSGNRWFDKTLQVRNHTVQIRLRRLLEG